ncbi:MAG TPA: anaerobic sulfite reductase subunit B [Thermoanaerobacterales bacterium]|nr:anaerobic sulfite reductase subunit B [Thermoanaerobacterales bacterium]
MSLNEYTPFLSKILSVQKHTDIEYTFRMAYEGSVKPGQFFEVSLPKFGEAPISVSGYGDGYVELTIRRVGKVTNEIFEHYEGESLFMRGPYGNGFDLDDYRGKELVVVAGGTGLSPVRGVIDYFASNPNEVKCLKVIAGFKSPSDILFFEDIARWKKTSQVILTVDCGEADFQCSIGFVTEHIPKLIFDDVSKAVAIVVGPPPMMHFSSLELTKLGFLDKNIWISQERKMCCGIGKCGHCKINDVYVCVDGPVFNYSKGKTLID